MLVVFLSWSFAVYLYPSTNPAYVDSATNNSVMKLIIGHNVLERIYVRQIIKSNIYGHNEIYSKLLYSINNTMSCLQEYLVKSYKEGSFLVVSERSKDVAQFIINTGLPSYACGLFLGSDNLLTPYLLKKYVSEGKITYFLREQQLWAFIN